MDETNLARNDASRAQLRALIARLTDADLGRPLGDGWTVATALAHLAFWDRYAAARLAAAAQEGVAAAAAPHAGALNDSLLPGLLLIAPRAAAVEALAAADACDRAAAGVDPPLAEALVAANLGRMLDRSAHRRAHIAQVEAALT